MPSERPIVVYNLERSYPPLPEGYYNGTLTLEENGMAFKGKNGEEIIIPWEHLVSTLSFSRPMRDLKFLAMFAAMGIAAPPFGIAFMIRPPKVAVVSIRWRDKEYDKLCDIELVIPPDMKTMGYGNMKKQAEAFDAEIWEAKKDYRGGKGCFVSEPLGHGDRLK